jgi:hypothetical protein
MQEFVFVTPSGNVRHYHNEASAAKFKTACENQGWRLVKSYSTSPFRFVWVYEE